MAKTKQDYVNEGMSDAQEGKIKSAVRTITSWQGQCYLSGWQAWHDEQASKAEGIRIAADIENEADARRLETVGSSEALGKPSHVLLEVSPSRTKQDDPRYVQGLSPHDDDMTDDEWFAVMGPAPESIVGKAEATAAAVIMGEVGHVNLKAVNLSTREVVNLRLPKKTVEALARLDPPNSMFHAFTDTPPMVVMKHVNTLCMERATETDALRRTRLLNAVNRIVDRWNKKSTLKRIRDKRLFNRGMRTAKLGMGLTKEMYEGLGFGH